MLSKILKREKGITLVALAVTIIVLIILASIGINLAFSDNGIIKEAQNAKESAEIDEEQGILKRAITISLIKSTGTNIEQSVLEKALNDEIGEGKTEVSDVGEYFEVMFTESNRYYEIDEDGKIGEVQYFVKDEHAGDITKGGKCDGSQEKPYEINCIEDLVVLSIMVNGGNEELNIKNNTFSGKYIVLKRTLNFNSKFSYNDSESVLFGDLNEDGIIEEIRTELTKTDEGCKGFKPIGIYANGARFEGNFDGQNNEIKNIYIYTEKDAGLFGSALKGRIQNLIISGEITSTNSLAGGIVAQGSLMEIYNCHNKATITGNNYTGGIGGSIFETVGSVSQIKNCTNSGEVKADNFKTPGGIVGGFNGFIIDCYNFGEVDGYCAGGIVGQSREKLEITNCANIGNVMGGKSGARNFGIPICYCYSE